MDCCDFDKVNTIIEKLFPKPDLIIHLAAQTSTVKSLDYPVEDFHTNAFGTLIMLQLASMHKAAFMYMGTRKSVVKLPSPYGLSKAIGWDYTGLFHRIYEVPTWVNIVGNVYGPGQDSSSSAFFFDHFIKASILNQPIHVYGHNGEQVRDMLYIDDLIELLLAQVSQMPDCIGEAFFVGGGKQNAVQIKELLEYLEYDNYVIDPVELPGDLKEEITSNQQLERLYQAFAWRPSTGWKTGADIMLAEYKEKLRV